ncbi:MAG: hypothetical protein LBC67_03275 [Spirochaetales bacterium]|jgi:hypothetical protein|nr:hypothetical protein [Spirochaetales bacterium]
MKYAAVLILAFCVLISCGTKSLSAYAAQDVMASTGGKAKREIRSRQFEKFFFTVLLPDGYEIEVQDDYEDFVVCYIKSGEALYGGIYFGNHPSSFLAEKEKDFVKESFFPAVLLGKKIEWEILKAASGADMKFFAEKLVKVRLSPWTELMHVWINGNSLDDVKKMIFIYSTIEKISE